MNNFSPVPQGYKLSGQGPLDAKLNFNTIAQQQALGAGSANMYLYYEGMIAFNFETKTHYIWTDQLEGIDGDQKVLEIDFVYPSGSNYDGINYSGKAFNFVLYHVWLFNSYMESWLIANGYCKCGEEPEPVKTLGIQTGLVYNSEEAVLGYFGSTIETAPEFSVPDFTIRFTGASSNNFPLITLLRVRIYAIDNTDTESLDFEVNFGGQVGGVSGLIVHRDVKISPNRVEFFGKDSEDDDVVVSKYFIATI